MGVDFFGQFLLRRGMISREQLLEMMALQESHNLRLDEYAIRHGFLTPEQCDSIHRKQRTDDRLFGEIAIGMGLLRRGQVEELLTRQLNDHLYLGEAIIKGGLIERNVLASELEAFQAEQKAYHIEEVQFPPGLNIDERIAVPVDLARKLFFRTAGIQVKLGRGQSHPEPPSNQLITVSILFTGNMEYAFALTLSRVKALFLAQRFMQTDEDFADEVVADALAEFCNIFCGDACSKYAQMGRSVEIAPPTFGAPGGRPTLLFPLYMPDEVGEIRIYLNQPSEGVRVRSG